MPTDKLPRLRLLARRTQGNTKAVTDVAARRRDPVAVRRPTELGGEAKTAATQHAVRARCSTTRVRYATTWVISIPILAPLPNIAVHIVQAPKHSAACPPKHVSLCQSSHHTKRTAPSLMHHHQNYTSCSSQHDRHTPTLLRWANDKHYLQPSPTVIHSTCGKTRPRHSNSPL